MSVPNRFVQGKPPYLAQQKTHYPSVNFYPTPLIEVVLAWSTTNSVARNKNTNGGDYSQCCQDIPLRNWTMSMNLSNIAFLALITQLTRTATWLETLKWTTMILSINAGNSTNTISTHANLIAQQSVYSLLARCLLLCLFPRCHSSCLQYYFHNRSNGEQVDRLASDDYFHYSVLPVVVDCYLVMN